MTVGWPYSKHRQLRAPREDRAVLVEPPFEEVPRLVAANRAVHEKSSYDLHGRCLLEVSREARQQLLAAARRWTSQYRDVEAGPLGVSAPFFLAGHQPQLFHPGVWFKNFALGALARQHGAVAINLLIDSDALKTAQVRVPGGSPWRPHVASVPLDAPGPIVPYEERTVLDREVFSQFGRRAAQQIAPLVADPMVREYWPAAIERMRQTNNLGAALAQSRHLWEGRWGLSTLEVPQSWIAAMRPHAWFVAHLLAELPRLRAVYNESVGEYRRAHRVRSLAHPVPNLAAEGDWLEAPFWIWTRADPRRRRLFARRRGREVLLSNRGDFEAALPLAPDGEAGQAADRLLELGARGVRIRSRALVTTLWARLVLGDLFVHGIGGAKYDEVTDAIIARFFGLEPPGFLIVSATLLLPVPRCGESQRASEDDLREIDRRLRELTYHAECYINEAGEAAGQRDPRLSELLEAKARWIGTPSTRQNARTRYREIRRINEALQPYVAPLRQRLMEDRHRAAQALEARAVLSGREYAFCLFAETTLREFFFPLLPKSVQIGSDKA